MKKPIVFGIGNERTFNHYTLEKSYSAIEAVDVVISKFGAYFSYEGVLDPSKKKNTKRFIRKIKDRHIHTSGASNARFDLFFADKKMFLTVVCNQKMRRKLNDAIFEEFEFFESKKTKRGSLHR